MRRKKSDKTSSGQVLDFPGSSRPAAAAKRGKKKDFKTILMEQAMDEFDPFDEISDEGGIPIFHKILFNDAAEFLLNLNVSLKACLYLDAETIPKKLSYTKSATENERFLGVLYHSTYPDQEDALVYDYEMEGFFREFIVAIIIDIHNRFEVYEARYAAELAEDSDFRIAMALIGATRTPLFQNTEQLDFDIPF